MRLLWIRFFIFSLLHSTFCTLNCTPRLNRIPYTSTGHQRPAFVDRFSTDPIIDTVLFSARTWRQTNRNCQKRDNLRFLLMFRDAVNDAPGSQSSENKLGWKCTKSNKLQDSFKSFDTQRRFASERQIKLWCHK